MEKGVESSSKEKRKGQVQAGHQIEERFAALTLLEKWERSRPVEEETPLRRADGSRLASKKKRGRPRKEVPGSERRALWMPKEYWKYVRHLELKTPAGRRRNEGMGSKIRLILDRYQVWEKREREQIKILQKYIAVMNDELKKYLVKYKRSGLEEELESIIGKMAETLKNLEMLLGILRIDVKELKLILSREEWEIFDLGYTVIKNFNLKMPADRQVQENGAGAVAEVKFR